MKVFNFMSERAFRLRGDWRPSWAQYVHWLKAREVKMKKVLVYAALVSERRKHNERVLRSYGLGPKQPRS